MGKVASGNGPGKLKHFQGKIVHRRNLHGNQEKSKKKEETLTAQRGGTSQNREVSLASQGKHLLRGCSFFCRHPRILR
jgi:hypothetical protein